MGKLTNKMFIYVTLIAIVNFSEIEIARVRSLLMMFLVGYRPNLLSSLWFPSMVFDNNMKNSFVNG